MPKEIDFEGSYPLLALAIKQGDARLFKRALSNKKGANVKDFVGNSVLHIAIKENRPAFVSALLKAGARLDARDQDKYTPLMVAAQAGFADICKILVSHGANLDSRDYYGRSALAWASSRGQVAASRVLLEAGADTECRDTEGCTPMMRAAQGGHADVMKVLVQFGGSVHSHDAKGQNALHWISMEQEWGASDDQESKKGDHFQACKFLLKLKCSLTTANPARKNETPLHLAAHRGNPEIVQAMISAGAAVDALDRGRATPLVRAAESPFVKANEDGGVKTLDALLRAGSDLNKVCFGGTALHAAAKVHNDKACFFLIKAGARTDLMARGVTAAGMATRHGAKELGKQIKAYKSSLQATAAIEKLMEPVKASTPSSALRGARAKAASPA